MEHTNRTIRLHHFTSIVFSFFVFGLGLCLQQGVRFDPDLPQTIRLEFAKSNTKVSKPKQPSATVAPAHQTLMHPLTQRKYRTPHPGLGQARGRVPAPPHPLPTPLSPPQIRRTHNRRGQLFFSLPGTSVESIIVELRERTGKFVSNE